MLVKQNRLIGLVIVYVLIAVVAALGLYAITKLILVKWPGATPIVRHGYDNSFPSILALISVLLFFTFLLYEGFVFLFPKLIDSMPFKITLGAIAGILPIALLQLSTFGISLSDPAMLSEFLVLGIAGICLPLTKRAIIRRA